MGHSMSSEAAGHLTSSCPRAASASSAAILLPTAPGARRESNLADVVVHNEFPPLSPCQINATFVSAVVKGPRQRGGQTNVSPKNTSCGHRHTQVRHTRKHVPRTFLSSHPRPADPTARLRRASCPSTQARRAFAQLLARLRRASKTLLLRRAHPGCAAAPRKLPVRLRRAGCARLLLAGCRRRAAPRARGPTSS